MNRKSIMRNKKLDSHSLNVLYSIEKTKLFPRLLEDPNIPNSDKEKIRELLNKPFNPYLRRNIGITEKSRQIPEHFLRLYGGWAKTSKMLEVYTHELGDEISNQILELEDYSIGRKEQNVLKSRICPNCQEPNKSEIKFCTKCRMILSYDAYTQIIKDNNLKDEQTRYERLDNQIKVIPDKFDSMQYYFVESRKKMKNEK